jgi:hypothetical protein
MQNDGAGIEGSECEMLMRSTGLGKTELSGRISGLVRHQDYLVLQVETVQPVKWKIRVAIARPDIWQVIKGILKWENMKVVLSTKWKAEPAHPGEF